MKFNVIIEETIDQDFEIEADSAEQAFEIARDRYRDCTYILDSPTVTDVKINVADDDYNNLIEWESI